MCKSTNNLLIVLQYFLDKTSLLLYVDPAFQAPYKGLIGNPVKFRDGPAAVNGDEIHDIATVLIRLGRCGWRMIR